jgi:ribosomal protein S12 methylthiotransferase
MTQKPSLVADARRFNIVTLGCAKNRVDTEGMETILAGRGYEPTADTSNADVVVVNTCGFLGAAREESVVTLSDLIQKRHPGQYIVAAGCMPALLDYKEVLPHGVDRVLTTREWFKIGDVIGSLYGEEPQPVTAGCEGMVTTFTHARHTGPSAYVKIADGCDHACAFCTIPSIKGRQGSKPPIHILQEIVDLVSRGTKEVNLVSQDTIRYGADLGLRHGLPDLMRSIAEQVPDLRWLRLLYIYPSLLNLRMLDTMAEFQSLVNYLDMPLQHADPGVLRLMNRPSDLSMVRRLLDHARHKMPDIAFRTTLIVGFPGETDEAFRNLLKFVETEQFEHVGVFTFSPEAGTKAVTLPDPVDPELADERRGMIMEAQQGIALRRNRQRIGSRIEVLVEAIGEAEDDLGRSEPVSVGRTWRNAPEVDGLVFLTGEHEIGSFVDATVVDAAPYDLWAIPAASAGATSVENGHRGRARTQARANRRKLARRAKQLT